MKRRLLTIAILASIAVPALAQKPEDRQAWFGDLHLHTSNSFDAYLLFGTGVTPDEAFKFARGEPVQTLGRTYRRREPLDFLAVTDHAERLGYSRELANPDSALSRSPAGQRARSMPVDGALNQAALLQTPNPDIDLKAIALSTWERTVAAANANNISGKFTALIAFEWSSTPGGANLHRNVIFRGDRAPLPFSAEDSSRPEDLWTYLEENRKNGIQALAIPHNANVSNGLMYDWNDSTGHPIDAKYALRRALNEPLAEISQNKGQSETHPVLSPDDEFAGFELFPKLLLQTTIGKVHGSYIREGLGRGLEISGRVGANPFKFGFVGASDLHTGLTISSQQDYAGWNAFMQSDIPTATARQALQIDPSPSPVDSLVTAPSSLTGVWAESNTRDAIWDALARKETFATSGSRLKLRLFGGWSYAGDLLRAGNWVARAYSGGVPMGGDLPKRPRGAGSPHFVVWALKDPVGVNLDRLQVIKVWQAREGHREKVFDVAKAGPEGAGELSAVWRDPEFEAGTASVYYVRALEVPTPRWSTLLARQGGLPIPASVPEVVQQRGWSSPIWYVPAR